MGNAVDRFWLRGCGDPAQEEAVGVNRRGRVVSSNDDHDHLQEMRPLAFPWLCEWQSSVVQQ